MSTVEVLVASLITAVAMLGAVNVFASASRMTQNTAELSIGVSLARRVIEEAKGPGFPYLNDGTTITYYDRNGEGASTTKGSVHRFTVTRVVSSDKLQTSTTVTRPAGNALRTLTVTVRRIPDNAVMAQTGTYLCRGGI
jgi:Tfp pilus assembly protein PilV